MTKIDKVIFKHSDVANKKPTAEQLDYGEIAINYAKDSEAIFFKNSENNVVEVKAQQKLIEAIKGSFVPVQINDNKSGATDATQLANIKAYASKLESSGVDISKGYEIPILYNSGSKGFIGYNPNASSYYNGYAVTPEGTLYTLTMNATDGSVSKKILATTTITDLLSTNKQPKTDNSLNTTSKTVSGAINEVNDKTVYTSVSDIKNLANYPQGGRVVYKGGDVTLSSPIVIDSNIYEVDFNGATITIGGLSKTGIAAIKGHSHCVIRNLIINGTWNVNTGVVSNVLELFAGAENISIDVTFSGSLYGRGFHNCQRLVNCKSSINANNGRAYNYCEYMYMCRVGDKSKGTGFFHCIGMDSCDVYNGACSGAELEECSNYSKVSYYVNNERKYFSDSDSVSVNGYKLDNFANTIAKVNDDDTKVLVHPSGGSGVSEVILSEDNVGHSVVRRDSAGRIHSWDGHYNSVLSTIDYVNAYTAKFADKATIMPILKEIDLTGTDADRKAKLDQFETDWKALTGASDLTGARFVGLVPTYVDSLNPISVLLNLDSISGMYIGISMVDVAEQIAVNSSDGSITITPLFSHLEAITIYTDNTAEHKKANLDNIAAYEANLQALGVDTSKGFSFLANAGEYVMTFMKSRNGNHQFFAIQTYNNENYITFIDTDGTYTESAFSGIYANRAYAESTYLKKSDSITEVKMNGVSKGTSGVIDLGTVLTAHQDISGKVDKTSLTPILREIDLTGTDEEKKAKLGQFETDWKALTGASDMSGARFVGKVTISGVGKSCLFTNQTIGTYNYVGFVYSIDSDDNINPVKVGLEYDEVGVHIHVAPAVEIATIAEIDKLFVIKTGSI